MAFGELPPRTSMRAYYHLENENDSSGNGKTLTNNNSVTFSKGKFLNAADFGTSGQRGLSLASNPFSAAIVTDFTISFWVKLNSEITTSVYRMFDMNTLGSTGTTMIHFIDYEYNSGTRRLRISGAYTGGTLNAYYTITLGTTQWYQMTFVRSNTLDLKLYINGILVTSGSGTGTDASSAASVVPFSIGTNRNLNAGTTWGLMDEFIIEERVWSPSEIRKYYTYAKGRFMTQN